MNQPASQDTVVSVDTIEMTFDKESLNTPPFEPAATKLPKVLTQRDLIVLMLLIVVSIFNTNNVQSGGPSAFVYWILGFLTFMIPVAYVTQWLGRRFPGQGAPYLWATRILGPQWGFIAAFSAWLPGTIAVVASIGSAITFIQYINPNWLTTPVQQGIATAALLLIPAGLACLPLQKLRPLLLATAVFYVGAVMLIGVAGVVWLISGHHAAASLALSNGWQPGVGTIAIYSVVILAFLGVDNPLFMGGEIRGNEQNAKKAASFVWWGSAITLLAYVAGTFGIMVVVPPDQSSNVTSNILAVQMVFGPLSGQLMAGILAVSQVILTIAYLLTFSRLLVLAAQDRRIPEAVAKLNKYGVPILSILIQSALVMLTSLLSLVILPSLFASFMPPANLATSSTVLMEGFTTVVWLISTVQMFALVGWFLYRRKQQGEMSLRQQIVLAAMCVIGGASSLFGLWITLANSWAPALISNGQWMFLILSITILSLISGLVIGEIPRVHALYTQQKLLNEREKALRVKLQAAYEQEQKLSAELRAARDYLASLASTDPLTGLLNHRALLDTLNKELDRSRRLGHNMSIIFFDGDRFKLVNDTYGHAVGDQVLCELGERINHVLRGGDTLARYGGEEFVVLLPETSPAEAGKFAEDMRIAIANYPLATSVIDGGITFTISIGVSSYPSDGQNVSEVLEQADQAMYWAKKLGRNQVCTAKEAQRHTKNFTLISSDNLQEQHQEKNVGVDNRETSDLLKGLYPLMLMLDIRDHGIFIHSHHVSELAVTIAREMGLSEQMCHTISVAGLLHDIGKIAIPDKLLTKAGQYTEAEWQIVKQHSGLGAQILEISPALHPIMSIIRHHHERWDGKGYPDFLAGAHIPLGSRIIAVAETYIEMSSTRPYQAAHSSESICEELQRCSGAQFDPDVVQAFMNLINREQIQKTPIDLHEAA